MISLKTLRTRPPSQYLGVYETLDLLGEGGMGKVYLGRYIPTGQEVAVKIMHPHLAKDPKSRRAFEHELHMMLRFQHPLTVSVLDGSMDTDGVPFLVREYVEGVTLFQVLEDQQRLHAIRAGKLLGQLCVVLHAMHDEQIMHRDLAPSNMIVSQRDTPRESIKLIDLGLARECSVESPTMRDGGTPDYTCPEQIRGEPVDHRGDIYSLGVLLYFSLTGHLPFEKAETTSDILLAHVKQDPPTFKDVGITDVPPPLEALVMSCLEKYPISRPQCVRELAERYERALGQRILPPGTFKALDRKVLKQSQVVPLDRIPGWMPTALAIRKLERFLAAIGSEVVEKDPINQAIRVRLRDPRSRREEEPGRTLPGLMLDLDIQFEQIPLRRLVEIDIGLHPVESDSPEEAFMRQGFGRRVCRELREFLTTGVDR